ncbi:hypothetical protein IV203_021787 [Nitzschia inconspicua]|uniref:Uncharacterized protein n=1 Tax=Nitzschia inconspicua TaxID=303405 RepID=A0A9K3KIL8_9STRA|nr:hypothetical protein IV203_021787 [Nitzschia inconspicua]
MRLPIAAAVLLETLPVVLSSSNNNGFTRDVISSASSTNGEGAFFQDILGNKRKGMMVQQNGKNGNKHPVGQKLKTINRRRLINSADDSSQECDPLDDKADVGILSCGTGRYCVESDDSSLGGYCVTTEVSRKLQDNSTLISDLFDACYAEDQQDSDCSCQGFNLEAYTGSISCVYAETCFDAPARCYGQNNTICYTQEYHLTITGVMAGTARTCYTLTAPEVQSYCYSLFIPDDVCEIEIDGTKCNSCSYTEDSDGCMDFDCTNTNFPTASSICGSNNIPTLMARSMTSAINALPCPNGCSICGEGYTVLNPDVNFTILEYESFTCGSIERAASSGYFGETDFCTRLAGTISETCGCTIAIDGPGVNEINTGSGSFVPSPNTAISMAGAMATAAALLVSM